MTVCIAALCRWNYSSGDKPDDWGVVAITASDRMITFGDVQYEPNQTKVANFSRNVMLLISGDYALHSEAIKTTMKDLAGRQNVLPRDVALMYGRAMQAIKRRHAEDIYLAPIGLNTDTLFAQQKEMSDSLTSALINQLQDYRGEEVEALVVGVEPMGAAIFHVDTRGTVTCADDVGFAAIGSGAWHARSQLMQVGYTNSALYFNALAAIFAAKKAADVSPGVGAKTDIHIVFRDNVERLEQGTYEKLHAVYDEYVSGRAEIAQKAVNSLISYVVERGKKPDHEQGKEQPGKDTQADGGASEDATETARTNESWEGEGNQRAAE